MNNQSVDAIVATLQQARIRAEWTPSMSGMRAHIQDGDQLSTVDLHKSYRKGSVEVPVLCGVTLGVRRGES